jgi:hypothetical protein
MQSINLTLAFIITQLVLLLMIAVGLFVLFLGTEDDSPVQAKPVVAIQSLFGLFAITSLVCLVFSEDIWSSSKLIFGGIELPTFSRNLVFLLVFASDLIMTAIIIFFTGGSQESPFSTIIFLIPTLGIFLRESPQRFFGYALGAAALFLITRNDSFAEVIKQNPKRRSVFFLTCFGSLLLSMIVGYSTRPF